MIMSGYYGLGKVTGFKARSRHALDEEKHDEK